MTKKLIVFGIAALVLVVAGVAILRPVFGPVFRGISSVPEYFRAGIFVGSDSQYTISASGVASTSATTVAHNGIVDTYVRSRMTTSTTTPCALPSPSSTSTLISWTVQFERSTTTVSLITLGKASTPYATTTKLGDQIQIATSSEDSIVASTTATQLEQEAHIFGPSEYAVAGMQVGLNGDPDAAGVFSPAGTCSAHFRSLL